MYVKLEQHSEVYQKLVRIQDVATLYSTNPKIVSDLNRAILFRIESDKPAKYCFSIIKVVDVILKQYPDLEISNLGETDFIVSLEKKKKKHPYLEYVKVAVVSMMIFFGGAFSIMTFNTDVSLSKVFDKTYELVMGDAKKGGSVLEIAYSIGLPLGIIVFYNHFSHKKRNSDPTPIQIEMRKYEMDTNTALIQDAEREGKTIE
ncbi:stage V sporulation protein AA [Lachnospiraceae bacterium KM106-2]|nr:stage V sporulation protein AA [Lachnospiraceae bacterium KM106-2]